VEVAAREGDEDEDDEAFRPGDWASLMQKAMIPTEDEALGQKAKDTPLSALAASRVFGSAASKTSWEGLGVPERLIARLRDPSLGFSSPTRAQQLAVPHILRGDDVLIRAETGSGKTLAYVCPLLAALGSMEPRCAREDGTRALVMVPTRELAAQVLRSAEELARCYHWVVCGALVGGENKQKEKARLRKGVVFLVATPGRLLDHLRNTESFKADALRWLVLDEADRLLDLGFEEDLNAILAEIERRAGSAGRCTALLSATLTKGTSRLMDLAMTDPVLLEVDPEEVEVVRSGTEDELRKSSATRAVASEALFDEKKTKAREDGDEAPSRAIARMPEQLRHTAVEVPAKARLATLAGLLAGWMRGAVPKVMVFFSSCESVEFHHRVLSWLAGAPEKNGTEKRVSGNTRDSAPYGVFRLHGVMSQSDRRLVYAGFAETKAGVLLCTDVGARGLDFENVGATVQVDAPSDPETYVHRVGRAARLGAEGEAVIFLAPRETEYASVLGELGVSFGAASVPAMLDVWSTG
jgi:ATP-dependent RNA helicase DDX31/DBP7